MSPDPVSLVAEVARLLGQGPRDVAAASRAAEQMLAAFGVEQGGARWQQIERPPAGQASPGWVRHQLARIDGTVTPGGRRPRRVPREQR